MGVVVGQIDVEAIYGGGYFNVMRNIFDLVMDLIPGSILYLFDLRLIKVIAIDIDQYSGGIRLNRYKRIYFYLFNQDGICADNGCWMAFLLQTDTRVTPKEKCSCTRHYSPIQAFFKRIHCLELTLKIVSLT